MAEEVEPETKYAAELNALDLGATMTLVAKHADQSYSKYVKRIVKKVRRIEHYGPNFGSWDKKNTVFIHGVGMVLQAKFDSKVEVKHGS